MFRYGSKSHFWWVGFLSIVLMTAAFYLILSHGFTKTFTGEFLTHESTIAKAGASNFESFFQDIGNSTAYRAQLSSKKNWDSSTIQDMDAYIDQWRDSGLVSGIILTDDEGVVRFNSNVLRTNDTGSSVADRDYFIWAKNQSGGGEYFIGQAVTSQLGASKGQIIVPVASPVFVDGVFRGVAATAVKLQPFVQRNLEYMKLTDHTKVYLIDANGDQLYSSSGSDELSGDLKVSLEMSQEGKLQKDGQLIAYAPVTLGDQKWSLVVASPIEDIFDFTISFYIKQAAVLMLLSVLTLIFGVFISRDVQNKL